MHNSPVHIPRTLPDYARGMLRLIDRELTTRTADGDFAERAREARWQLSRATGNAAYFLHLYLETMEGR